MKKNNVAKKIFMQPLSSIFGVTVLLTEFLFTLPSMIIWNKNNEVKFNPFVNWHSDLGNMDFNAGGHFWYNTGQVVQSIAIIFFAGGLYILNEKRKEEISIRKGQIFLIAAGISLLICGGLYPETVSDIQLIEKSSTERNFSFLSSPHIVLTFLLFIFLTIGIGFTAWNLRKVPEYKIASKFGLFAFAANAIILPANILFNIPIVEYIAVFSAEIFIAFLGINIFSRNRYLQTIMA